MDEISIRETFRGKNVLITGASGFLGKVWLCMALARFPEVEKIYVLMRSKAGLTAKQRLEKIINSSPVFSILHERYQGQLGPFLAKHVQVVDGDISLPFFGMAEPLVRRLTGNVDLILNCAGIVDFSPDLRDAFLANVEGPLHAARLARTLGAALLHVSTAYVTGSREGEIEETFIPNYCPSAKTFDVTQEYEEISRLVNVPNEKSWTELGREKANHWGWPNAYAYTKSLAESLVADQAGDLRFSFFRPTIVESSLRFPFPGWNEGITTCAPLSYLASYSVRAFPLKPTYSLDLIPVDLVCEGMTVAAAALLTGKAKRVYQCGTSDLNPLSQRFAIEMMNLNHREYFQANGKGMFEKLYLARSHPVIVDEKSFFTAPNFKKLTTIALDLAELLSPHLPQFARGAIETGKRALKKAKWEFIKAERILETYQPFLQYDYVFKTKNLKNHRILEAEFQFQPENISWSDYIVNVHEPGLRKWCFPLIEGNPIEEFKPTHPCVLPCVETFETAARPIAVPHRELKVISNTRN